MQLKIEKSKFKKYPLNKISEALQSGLSNNYKDKQRDLLFNLMMDVTRIYFTIYQLLVNFLLPGILMVACYSGSSIIGKSVFFLAMFFLTFIQSCVSCSVKDFLLLRFGTQL